MGTSGSLGRGKRGENHSSGSHRQVSTMRWLSNLAFLSLVACGPLPGGSLSGVPANVPATWSDVIIEKTLCEIESRPADPHSIQLECFLFQGDLYAQSHRWVNASWWPTESWATIWQQEPNVTVRIGESLYSLTANVERDHRQTILKERGYDPVPDGIVVFRFEPATQQD